MHILDFYPSQGSFLPGEPVTFLIEIESLIPEQISLKIFIQHLAEQPVILEHQCQIGCGSQTIQIDWNPPETPAGYSARLLIDSHLEASTAFDVLSSWIDFPRYGFLSDFGPLRADPEIALKKLIRFHINGLQFYDWQYRHDQLLAATEEYTDPLGRALSLVTVRKLVDTAHQYGMAAMPYLAIYAASADFWHAHPDWALYDEAAKPIAFGENFLGLMDPSAGRSWSQHLLAEGIRALQDIPFDGLHIDQYGDPKIAWDARHNLVDLPRAFVEFIQSASEQHPNQTVLFNAVGNWPVEALAESEVDFMYIEVWPPDLEYRRLAEIVLNAVRLSRGKAVVIAHYLPADRSANNLLADAVILACGGTRIELGEEARLLSDPYFPKHEQIPPDLYTELRKLADFTVRNGEWLRPYTLSTLERETWSKSDLNPDYIDTDESIMILVRRQPKLSVIQMVNFTGLDSHQHWDVVHATPTHRQNVSVKIQMSQQPAQVFWDCPEQIDGPQAVRFEYSHGILTFHIPQINYTGLVAIHE